MLCSGPGAQVCCLFLRLAVTHLAGSFPWVTSMPGVVPGDGEVGEKVGIAK